MHPEELAELEQIAGRALGNKEAQLLLHALREWNMYMDFVEKGRGELR